MNTRRVLVVFPVLLAAAACDDRSLAYGDANSIIAVMDPALWNEVESGVYEALEPTLRTVRNERTFTVTFQDPSAPEWRNLRRFRQMLLVGTEADPWIAEAMAEADEPQAAPGLLQVHDVWARGQQATVVLLSQAGAVSELQERLPEIHRILDGQYREFARRRMYFSGADSALADSLHDQARFRLLLPTVYRWERKTDSVYVFRNDNPDPSELIRQVAVTWRSPVPPGLQPEDLLSWRASLVAEHFEHGQDVDLSQVDAGPFKYRGHDAYQIQAAWSNPPELEWPAGGPFTLRAVVCPEQARMYLLDAWLYAPGKEKYEYMIQIETILDSFRCGAF